MLKKNINSEGDAMVVVGNGDQSRMFLKGYKYMLADTIYTVLKRIVADNTEMRQIKNDDGVVEDVTVETILKDHDPQRNGGVQAKVLDRGPQEQ